MASKHLSTDAITAAIERHYAPPRWATLFEVRDGAGFNARRSADVIAVSLWPSQGLHIHGIEVKSSASDLYRELDNPRKAESLARYCDFWWLACNEEVAASAAFERVPHGWGVRVITSGKKMRTVRQPQKIKAKPLDREFVVCVLRRHAEATAGMIWPSQIAEKIEQACQERMAKEKGRVEYEMKAAVAKAEKLEGVIESFRTATGINIRESSLWHGKDFLDRAKRAFDIVRTESEAASIDRLKAMQEEFARCAAVMAESIARLEQNV